MEKNQTHSNFYGSPFYLQMEKKNECKNEEDPFKIESTRVVATFLPL